MDKAAVAVPPVLLMQVNAPELGAPLKVTNPPSSFPNWLLLMLMVLVMAPALEMAVNAPLVEDTTLLRMMLLLMFAVTNAVVDALLMALNAPVPALVPEVTLFPVMVSVPTPTAAFAIPV